MPQVYTIATKNAFAALDDSVSDHEGEERILPQAPPAPVPERPQRSPPAQQQQQQQQPTTPSRGANRRAPRRQQDGAPANQSSGDEAAPTAGRSTEGGAPRFPRAPKRGPMGERTGNIERLDRQSGTGRGRENKKEGGGAYNWGNRPADYGAEEETPAAKVEGENSGAEAEAVPSAAPVTAAEELGPQSMSYADYKAQMEQSQAFAPKEVTKSKNKVESGYQVYVKDSAEITAAAKQPAALGDEEKSRPKAMHLAELAAQSGSQLRFQGGSRSMNQQSRPNNRGNREDRPYKPRSGEKPAAVEQKPEPINLADDKAFPTL